MVECDLGIDSTRRTERGKSIFDVVIIIPKQQIGNQGIKRGRQ